jgi:sterol desaturase/sphingolipid hydroxylase (fatty acid hydroxylase superfamily)
METQQHHIMRRVRRVYYMKKLIHPTVMKLYGVGAVLGGLLSLVSVPSVLANTPGNVWSGMQYLASALWGTDLVVQVLLLLIILFTGMVMRDLVVFFTHQNLHGV